MRPPTVSQPFLFFCQTADEDYGDGGPRDGYERAEAERAQDAADMAEAEEAAKAAEAAKVKKATVFVSYVITQELKSKYPALRGAVGDPLRHPNDDSHKTKEEIEEEQDRRASMRARGKVVLRPFEQAQRKAYFEEHKKATAASTAAKEARKGRSIQDKLLVLGTLNYCKRLHDLGRDAAIKEVGADEYFRVFRHGGGIVLDPSDVSACVESFS